MVAKAFELAGIAGIAGDEQHRQIGPAFLQFCDHFGAGQAGHQHVAEDQVEPAMRFDQPGGGARIVASDRLMAKLGHGIDGGGQDALVVLDHQDAHRVRRRFAHRGIGTARGRRRFGMRLCDGQQHRNARAFALDRMNLHLAARLATKGKDLTHPQARALTRGFRGVEGVEHALEHLGRHAAAGIDHLDRQRGGVVLFVAQRPDRQRPVPVHRVARVDGKVEQRIFELLLVDPAGEPFGLKVERQRDAVADRAPDQFRKARDAGVDRRHFGARGFGAREGQQAAGQVGGAIGPVHRIADVALCLFGRFADPPLRKFQPADDDSEHIVEIMRDAAGQLADRFHLLRLAKLLLGGGAFGHFAAQRAVRFGQLGRSLVDRRLQQHRAVALGQLFAPCRAAFALRPNE